MTGHSESAGINRHVGVSKERLAYSVRKSHQGTLVLALPPLILGKSRMRKRACTDLCGGRSAMVVPTATVMDVVSRLEVRFEDSKPVLESILLADPAASAPTLCRRPWRPFTRVPPRRPRTGTSLSDFD